MGINSAPDIRPERRIVRKTPRRYKLKIILLLVVGLAVASYNKIDLVGDTRRFVSDIYGKLLLYGKTPLARDEKLEKLFARFRISIRDFDEAQVAKLAPMLGSYSADYCDARSKSTLIAQVSAAGFVRLAGQLSVDQYERCSKELIFLLYASTYYRRSGETDRALEIVNRVIERDPASANGRYSRGKIFETRGQFDKALIDQVSALDLFGKPETLDEKQYYEIARMYAALGKFCEAASPLETYISFNPAKRRSTRLLRLIDEYLSKGDCKRKTKTDNAVILMKRRGMVYLVEAAINDILGVFVLDTGATSVTITKSFADKARVTINPESKIKMQTANGITDGILSTADSIKVGGASSAYIPVVISDDAKLVSINDPDNVVGLLGMSFLSKFDMTISNGVLQLNEKKQ